MGSRPEPGRRLPPEKRTKDSFCLQLQKQAKARIYDAFVPEFTGAAFGPLPVDSYNMQKGGMRCCKGTCPGKILLRRGAADGGNRAKGALANHWKQWDAKPEAGAPKGELRKLFDVTLVRLQLANHWKQWDAKPEAKARNPAPCSFGCDWQTAGNGGTQSQRLQRGTPRHARSVAAGKPLETMGRKARG